METHNIQKFSEFSESLIYFPASRSLLIKGFHVVTSWNLYFTIYTSVTKSNNSNDVDRERNQGLLILLTKLPIVFLVNCLKHVTNTFTRLKDFRRGAFCVTILHTRAPFSGLKIFWFLQCLRLENPSCFLPLLCRWHRTFFPFGRMTWLCHHTFLLSRSSYLLFLTSERSDPICLNMLADFLFRHLASHLDYCNRTSPTGPKWNCTS